MIKFYPKNFLILLGFLCIGIVGLMILRSHVDVHAHLNDEALEMLENKQKLDESQEKVYKEYRESLSEEESREEERQNKEDERRYEEQTREEDRIYNENKDDWVNQPTGKNDKLGWTIASD